MLTLASSSSGTHRSTCTTIQASLCYPTAAIESFLANGACFAAAAAVCFVYVATNTQKLLSWHSRHRHRRFPPFPLSMFCLVTDTGSGVLCQTRLCWLTHAAATTALPSASAVVLLCWNRLNCVLPTPYSLSFPFPSSFPPSKSSRPPN